MHRGHQLREIVKNLRARRTYPCPRCRNRLPTIVAKCYRCGWSDRVTTANLEAQGGLASNPGADGSMFGGEGLF